MDHNQNQNQNQNDRFLASLDEKDRIIHELAKKMLATRYDPARTNAFGTWVASVSTVSASASAGSKQ